MTMTRFSLTSTAAAALLALSLPAGAAPFQAYYQDASAGSHGAYGASSFSSASFTGTGGSASAGAFALKGDLNGAGVEDFIAWCADIAHNLSPLSKYDIAALPVVGQMATDLKALVNTVYDDVVANLGTAEFSAGFQLAVWEILNESGGSYDVASGSFAVTGGSAAAKAKANEFLANLDYSAPVKYNITYLQSQADPKTQGLVTVSPVPLPAAGLLLFGALGGLGMIARRRKSAEA